jgi:phosphatidylglycerophosphatase A
MHEDIPAVRTSPTRIDRLALWIATGLGFGMVTPAPGTIAGLWGLGLAAIVAMIPRVSGQLLAIAVLIAVAVPICGAAAKALGAKHDPGSVVLDEIVALPIVFLWAPPMNWAILLTGYVLFRICDIWKPGLARAAEELPDGWGIVADDALAAVLACILLHGALWLDAAMNWHWLLPPQAA